MGESHNLGIFSLRLHIFVLALHCGKVFLFP